MGLSIFQLSTTLHPEEGRALQGRAGLAPGPRGPGPAHGQCNPCVRYKMDKGEYTITMWGRTSTSLGCAFNRILTMV